jgi:hypothetical protein
MIGGRGQLLPVPDEGKDAMSALRWGGSPHGKAPYNHCYPCASPPAYWMLIFQTWVVGRGGKVAVALGHGRVQVPPFTVFPVAQQVGHL